MNHKITLIPGDGTGPEIVYAVKKCIDSTGANIEWEEMEAGLSAIEKYGTPLPSKTLDSIKRNKIALKIENAWKEVIEEGKDVTYDLKLDRNDPSVVGTIEMINAIIKKFLKVI